jgi:predicted hydrocarbon binding protein/KaiC/GvpD/RAD55 family RecA-like ATPase
MASIAQLQEVPPRKMVLLVGRPGSGKSTFCQKAILQNLAMDGSTIFVTTEYDPSDAEKALRERGLGEVEPGLLNFVDAYNETVGVSVADRPDTVRADCDDLSSIDIGISKLRERMGRSGILLVFDSLTSPYLFTGTEILRFMRQTLSRFAARGNAVLACMDEGCGREEDLGAMMSFADGIIKMEIKESSRVISVVKHPVMAPTRIETPITWSTSALPGVFDLKIIGGLTEVMLSAGRGQPVRTEVGDFLNLFWPNFARWSGMLWDPKRLPAVAYEFGKEAHARSRELMASDIFPWRMRLLMKLFVPKSFSEVRDMKKLASRFLIKSFQGARMGIWEYVEEESRKDEHYFRVYENSWCSGLDNVGARLDHCGQWVGLFKALEKEERDWNMVETKCIGMGSPYCEFKVVPGEIGELKDSLEALDSSVLENIHDRLMDQLTGFLVHGKPLPERPRLGSEVMLNSMFYATSIPALFNERYRMALRMGGARAGKNVAENLMNAGMAEDEVVKRVIDFMEYCKVGKITIGDTIRIRENCETFGLETGEPSCFFTTGLLNGLFSTLKNQHLKETKCIAMGDPYCEWEFR